MVLLNKSFVPRRYQETIFATATGQNTLVVLPTGMGKTAIAAMTAAHRLEQRPECKVVFLAPTRPLVQQHLDTFKQLFSLPEEQFALFTGHTKPEKRVALWQEATFIFSTPQGMENDLIGRKLDMQDVSLLIFDEAHRATGDYAYTFIAEHYHKLARHERILALTASPGSDEQSIKDVCANLFIEEIEVRSTEDADVQQYVQALDIKFKNITLTPEIQKVRKYLSDCYQEKIKDATSLGMLYGDPSNYSKTTLLSLQASLHAKTAQGEKTYEVLKTISLLAEALKVQHALELCESQSVSALLTYLHQLQKLSKTSKTKAVQNLVKDLNFRSAVMLAETLQEKGVEHPKMAAIKEIVTKEIMDAKDKKIIVFTQFRDTALVVKEQLQEIATSEIFVGQAKKGTTGLSQKKQKEMLERFREGAFQVLIATSVAEEGLDIPSVDTVVFYEPIPSAIRTVQRRGRTGRHDEGNVYLLIATGTRDEGYRWSAHHKEKRMYRNLAKIKQTFKPTNGVKAQATLNDYKEENDYTITVDYREKGSPVMKALLAQDVKLDLAQMPIGDYKVSEDVIVEYKTVRDFVDSIIDGRLLGQLSELRTYYKPIIIIEGTEDLYAQRRISPAAIRGMLAAIALSYHIPVLRTSTPHDTAGVLLALAKRTLNKDKQFQAHISKPWTQQEQQEYVIASLPGIGSTLAKPLLEKFGSVLGVMNATLEELQEVELIGEKKAKAIRELLDANYSRKA